MLLQLAVHIGTSASFLPLQWLQPSAIAQGSTPLYVHSASYNGNTCAMWEKTAIKLSVQKSLKHTSPAYAGPNGGQQAGQ